MGISRIIGILYYLMNTESIVESTNNQQISEDNSSDNNQ